MSPIPNKWDDSEQWMDNLPDGPVEFKTKQIRFTVNVNYWDDNGSWDDSGEWKD